jgi:hypothetical protein
MRGQPQACRRWFESSRNRRNSVSIASKFHRRAARSRSISAIGLNYCADRYSTNSIAKNLSRAAQIVANRFDALRADLLIISSSSSPSHSHHDSKRRNAAEVVGVSPLPLFLFERAPALPADDGEPSD